MFGFFKSAAKEGPTEAASAGSGEQNEMPCEPENQRKFDTTLRTTNALVKVSFMFC